MQRLAGRALQNFADDLFRLLLCEGTVLRNGLSFPASVRLIRSLSRAHFPGLVYVARLPPAPFPPRLFLVARTKLEIKGDNTPVTQATACVSRLIQSLPRRCSRRMLGGMPDPTVSY